ncbi:hypothetical protein ACFWP3_14675 [Streptomyces sp. NPDC058525]|uniref:hypothetical protein n=1 Tax=Streptomyces sp. NPDC058525 TaxID=3346538 RepID=UPI00365C650B
MSSTLALIESPAQLLNLLEWVLGERRGAHDPERVRVAVLLPRDAATCRQLDAMASLAGAEGIRVSVHDIRRHPAALARCGAVLGPQLAGAGRLVLGDPFSGLIQRLLPLARSARDVVLVDDGTATLELATQLLAGRPLVRWHTTGPAPAAARRATRHLTPGHGRRLEVFSSIAKDLLLPPGGVVAVNTYSWTRSRFGPPEVLAGTDLVGTSLAETGLVDQGRYVAEVAALAKELGCRRYLAHRREDPAKLERIARATGTEILLPELPLELALRTGPVGRTVVSFASTVVHTLPAVLAGTGVEVAVHDGAVDWLKHDAPDRVRTFLEEVITTARNRHRLRIVHT